MAASVSVTALALPSSLTSGAGTVNAAGFGIGKLPLMSSLHVTEQIIQFLSGKRIALRLCLSVPNQGLGIILLNALAVCICVPQTALRT